MLKIYGIKNCDSVRKAIKFLKSHSIPYEFIDFRETPVDRETIESWLEHTDIKTLFNTRGTTYRTLKLKDLDLTDSQKVTWLAKVSKGFVAGRLARLGAVSGQDEVLSSNLMIGGCTLACVSQSLAAVTINIKRRRCKPLC